MRHSIWAVLAVMSAVPAVAEPAQEAGPSAFERRVLATLNEVRADPRRLARELRAYREGFDGRLVHENGDSIGVWTNEGVNAVDEAIAFLERQPARAPLDEAPTLHLAALDLVSVSGPAGTTGHLAAGRMASERVSARGGGIYVGEVISYGQESAAAVVRQLVVDDGVPGRGHRALVFSDRFRFAGVSCGPHARWGTMCAVDLSASPVGGPAGVVALSGTVSGGRAIEAPALRPMRR